MTGHPDPSVDRAEKTASPAPVPFFVARGFTVVITAVIWGMILAGIGAAISAAAMRGAGADSMSADAIRAMMAVAFVFIPFFTGQGALTGMLAGHLAGRFILPDKHADQGATGGADRTSSRARNPWSVGLVLSLALGAPAALAAIALVPMAWPGGLPLGAFLPVFAGIGAMLAAISACSVSGRVFLAEAGTSREDRAWSGSTGSYIWFRQMLPQGLANMFINAAVAIAIFPHPIDAAGGHVPLDFIVGDVFITGLVLAVAMLTGVGPHTSLDARWGVIQPLDDKKAPGPLGQMGLLVCLSMAFALVTWLSFTAGGIAPLGLTAFVLWRAFFCALFAGLAARMVARWALRRVTA